MLSFGVMKHGVINDSIKVESVIFNRKLIIYKMPLPGKCLLKTNLHFEPKEDKRIKILILKKFQMSIDP